MPITPVQPASPASRVMQPAQFSGQQPSAAPARSTGRTMPAGKPPTEAFQRLVMAGARAVYTPSVAKGIVQMLSTGPEKPEDELAQIATMILRELIHKARGRVPDRALMPAALSLLGLVVEVAEAGGAIQRDPELLSAASQQVIKQVIDLYKSGAFKGDAPEQPNRPAPPTGSPEDAAFEQGFRGVTTPRAAAAPVNPAEQAMQAGFRAVRPTA